MSNATQESLDAVSGRPLTGRMVLAIFLAFFGVVMFANMMMLRAAMNSFSGVGEKNAYVAGLAHDRQLAAARAQDARGWKVDVRLNRVAAGRTEVSVARVDAGSAAGLVVLAHFEHPADQRQDRTMTLAPQGAGAGSWRSALDLPAGSWNLVIEMRRGGEVLFQSRDRVTVTDSHG